MLILSLSSSPPHSFPQSPSLSLPLSLPLSFIFASLTTSFPTPSITFSPFPPSFSVVRGCDESDIQVSLTSARFLDSVQVLSSTIRESGSYSSISLSLSLLLSPFLLSLFSFSLFFLLSLLLFFYVDPFLILSLFLLLLMLSSLLLRNRKSPCRCEEYDCDLIV